MTGYMEKLKGKEVIVVGGSSGIGFGAAAALLSSGCNITIISSSQSKVENAISRLQATVTPPIQEPTARIKGYVGDVRNEEEFVGLLRKLADEIGGFDHLIFSSVDKLIRGKLEDLNLDDAKWLFGVKFWGAVITGKAILNYPILKSHTTPGTSSSSLTLTSGLAAIKPGRAAAVGAALNGGVLSLTKGLASDLAEKGIRVNCVIPGLVQTELWDSMGKSAEEQKRMMEAAAKRMPVKFVATPEHIAEAYLYAVRADYVTGSLIEIDGGSTLDTGEYLKVPSKSES